MESVSIHSVLERDVNIIDIRSKSLYLKGHIPHAISIEEEILSSHPELYLKMDEEYYIYCSSGIRSSLLCSYLNRLGYRTFNIKGGYYNYLLLK